MKQKPNVLLIAPPVPSIEKISHIQEMYWTNYYRILFSKVCSSFSGDQLKQVNNLNVLRIGILSIANALYEAGANVVYLGPGVMNDEKQFIFRLDEILKKDMKFLFAGISVQTTTYPLSSLIAEIIKKVNPNIPLVLGGPHAATMYEQILNENTKIDICVNGIGEQPAVKLYDFFLNPDRMELKNIKGISFRNNGEIVKTEQYKPDQSYMPTPLYSIIKESLPMVRVYNSIGCPYRCLFCAEKIWHNKLYHGEEKKLRQNVTQLYDNNQTRFFFLGDEDFAISKSSLENAINVFLDFRDAEWGGQTRVDTFLRLDDNTIGKMVNSGFRELHIGFESGNEDVLVLNGKSISLEDSIKCCKKARKFPEIMIGGYFLVGLPGDTRETIQETIEFAHRLVREDHLDLVEFNTWVPSPGSKAMENKEMYGINEIKSSDYVRLRGENNVMHSVGNLQSTEIEMALEETLVRLNYVFEQKIADKNISKIPKLIDLGLMGLF